MTEGDPGPSQRTGGGVQPLPAEGSPYALYSIHPGYSRALAGVVAAAALAVTASLSESMTAIAVALIGALIAIGWPKLLGLPNQNAPYPILILSLLASIAVGIFGQPALFALVAAGALIGTFVTDMFRRDGGTFRVEQLSGTFLGCLLMISAAMWVPAVRLEGGPQLAIGIAVTIVVVSLIHAFDSPISAGLGLVNGVITAVAAAWILRLPWFVGLLVGIAVGTAYFLTQQGVRHTPRPSPRRPGLSRALIPHAGLGIFAYALAWFLL